MLKSYISVFFISILLCCGTSPQAPVADVDADENVDVDVEKVESFIKRIDTLGLKFCIQNFPACGAPMVKRYAKRGSNQGKAFWSCSKYTETGCNGSRNIQD